MTIEIVIFAAKQNRYAPYRYNFDNNRLGVNNLPAFCRRTK